MTYEQHVNNPQANLTDTVKEQQEFLVNPELLGK